MLKATSNIVNVSQITGVLPVLKGGTGVTTQGPAFRAFNSTGAQSITTGTFTKVLFDTEVFDTNSNFASSRFTPTIAGYYQINVALAFSGTGMTRAIIGLYKNGVVDTFGNDISGPINTQIASTIVFMNGSTDFIETYVYIDATSPSISSAASYPFSGSLIRFT